jgi:alpha-tubulin suppressor-like RCC1 family protein
MLNSQNLINKICDKIDEGGLTDLQTCQLTNALTFLNDPVIKVATVNDLPNPLTYKGRMIFVEEESRYYYARDNYWVNNFDSQPLTVSSELWAWGCNASGQLGTNNTISQNSPVSVVGGFTDWCQVSSGFSSNIALRSNGTLWAWGQGLCGRLGTGNTINRSSPVPVVGEITDWCRICAGEAHALAQRSDGSLWGWGCNGDGRIADGTAINRSSPVSVVGGITDWIQFSTGNNHSGAIRCDGTLWTWGLNDHGQLGDGTVIDKSSPVSVVGGFCDWCQTSIGSRFQVALRTNGTAWTWGCGGDGRLGTNEIVDRSSPVSVVGGITDWCRVAAGFSHVTVIRSDGMAWVWGLNAQGRIGTGDTVNYSSPVSVVGGFIDWCQIDDADRGPVALRTNGTAWAWGDSLQGRLGNGNFVNRSSPVSVVGGFNDWYQISSGWRQSIGIRKISKGF